MLAIRNQWRTVCVLLVLGIYSSLSPNSWATNTTVESVDCSNVPSESEFLLSDANSGKAYAQWRIANLYAVGHDIFKKDIKEAYVWFRKSAEQGVIQAQNIMGLAYSSHLDGIETYGREHDLTMARELNFPDDYLEAAKWFKRAAEQGDNTAKVNLSLLYRDGLGVTQDYKEAFFWMFLGTKGNNDFFKKNYNKRDEIAKKLSPQELDEVMARIANWKETHEKTKTDDSAVNLARLMCGEATKKYKISACGNLYKIERKDMYDAGETYIDRKTKKMVTSCGWDGFQAYCHPFRPDWPCGKE